MQTQRSLQFVLLTLLSILLTQIPVPADDESPVRLTLPAEIYAVPGLETNIYFANTVLATADQELTWEAECLLGQSDDRSWTLTPDSSDIGNVSLTIRVKNANGAVIDQASTHVKVVPRQAGSERTINLLIVGDSLTHASVYPNEIARLLNAPENPDWSMLGTHKPASAAERVVHEGYGGWTWAAFNSKFAKDSAKPGSSSPFVFAGSDGMPFLNLARYFDERCDGVRPDFIIVMLGINDCFGFNPNDAQKLDDQIDGVFSQAEILLSQFFTAAPNAEIGLCLTTPGNSRDEAFVANYKDRYSRAGWNRIQHRLVEKQLAHFGGRTSEHLFIVPTELSLDTVDGYPTNNAVHPNTRGYQQIGQTVYAWLKWRLSEK